MGESTVEHPTLINIETTQRCNLKCKMCGRVNATSLDFRHSDMTMDIFEKILPIMGNAKTIWLSGFGEPLLHKNIARMVRMAKDNSKDAEVSFTTNAMLLTADKASELIDAGLDKMQVSIDGSTSWGHVGGGGSIEKVVANLKRLNDIKASRGKDYPKVIFAFVGMKDNLKELSSILDIAHGLGVDSITVQPLRPISEKMRDQNIYRHLDYAKREISRAADKAKRLGIKFEAQFMDFDLSAQRRECTFPNYFIHVSYDGLVYMCCGGMSSGYNVMDKPIIEIWNSDAYAKIRESLARQELLEKCRVCSIMFNTIENQERDIQPEKSFRQKLKERRLGGLVHSAKSKMKRILGIR